MKYEPLDSRRIWQQRAEKAEAELSFLRTDLAATRGLLQDRHNEINNLKAEITDLHGEIDDCHKRILQKEAERDGLRTTLRMIATDNDCDPMAEARHALGGCFEIW